MSESIRNDASVGGRRRRTVRIEISPKSMVFAGLIAAGVWVAIRLAPALMVLLVALMIVGTLVPAVRRLQAHRIGRRTAILIVFGLLLLVLIGMVTLTLPALIAQLSNLIDQEPVLRAHLVEFLGRFRITEFLSVSVRDVHYDALIKSAAVDMLAMSARMIEVVAYTAGAFFLAFYMMFDSDRLLGALFLTTPRQHHIRLSRILLKLETIVGGYIRGQLLTCLLMGAFMFLLLTVCGVPNALALATFGGAADVLPFVGIFLTMIPALLASIPQGAVVTIVLLVLMLCYEEFESRVLVPVVYGRALRLPSSVVLFALIAGGALAGIAAAQFLAFQATARSSAEAGADVVTAVPRPQWQLGPSPWLLTAGALVAVITGVLARPDQSAEPAIRPRAADGPGPPQLPGRPDALPTTRSLQRRAC
jgi:predicted PurR-regulated permease PerM